MRILKELRREKRQRMNEKIRNGELSFDVPYPQKKAEAEIQAELWYLLRENGFDARMEVKHTFGSKKEGLRASRFDVVIYDENRRGVVIIEVKNNGKKPKQTTRQVMKYECYNAELIYCTQKSEIDKAIKETQEIFKKLQWVKLQSGCNGLIAANHSPMSPMQLSHAKG